MLGNQFDSTRDDPELMAELELTTRLVVAAAEFDGRLPQEQIDEVLGVRAAPSADRVAHETRAHGVR